MTGKRSLSLALVASLLLPQVAWVQQAQQPVRTPATTAAIPIRPIVSIPTFLDPRAAFKPFPAHAQPRSMALAAPFFSPSRTGPLGGARGFFSKRSSTQRDGLRLAEQALSGGAEAGRLRPGLARLGSTAASFDPSSVSHAGMREAASRDFFHRANQAGQTPSVAPDFPQDPSPPAAADTAGAKSRDKNGKGGSDGGKPGDPKAPKQAPKYPARDIDLNGKATLPSTALLPDRPIEPLIVEAIDATNDSLLIAAYEFKSREILKALRRARDRGVKIQIILNFDHVFPVKRKDSDYVPKRSLEIQSLLNERFDVQILRGMWRYGIMHNKFMVFDGKVAEFGSYNYTWTTENHHFENAKFTNDAAHVAALAAYWNYMRELSVAFDQARGHLWPESLPPPPADPSPSVRLHEILLPTFFFSPGGSGEDWISKAIEAARESIDVSVFTLDSTRIAQALAAAHDRGVRVRVILDRSQFESDGRNDQGLVKTYGEWLAYHGVAVSLRAGPDPDGPEMFQKNHNKFMVIDGAVVETGSPNWTKNASLMNFENGHFTDDATDTRAFAMFFEDLYAKASPVEAPETEPRLLTDEELEEMLRQPPTPLPPPPVWPDLPEAPSVVFHDEQFPAYAFRPQHPIAEHLIRAIHRSQKTIHLALYEFTLPRVLEALRGAKKRGVKIHVVLDDSHVYPRGVDHEGDPRERSPEIQALIDDGFDVTVARGLGANNYMHHKFAIFDGEMAEFGSYNWGYTAEDDHFENALFSTERARVEFYMRLWRHLRDYSVSVKEGEDYDWSANPPPPPPVDTNTVFELNGSRFARTYASPRGGVQEVLIAAIEAARVSIDIAMFSFYSQPIADALLAAKNRGVAVRLVLDDGQSRLMKLDQWFAYHDFAVRILAGPDSQGNVMFQKMHHKYLVVDGRLLATGSYNYTKAAEDGNFENVNFFMDPAVLAGYAAEFAILFENGWAPYKPKESPLDRDRLGTSQFFATLSDNPEAFAHWTPLPRRELTQLGY